MKSRDRKMLGLRTHESASCRLNYSMGVPKEYRDGLRELSHLYANVERKGHATELMRKVCAEADKGRIVLMLVAKTGMEPWYERFGFYLLPDSDGAMARPVQVEEQRMLT